MMLKLYALLLSYLFLSGGCYPNLYVEEKIDPGKEENEPSYEYQTLRVTTAYDSSGMRIGTVNQNEISGLALSRNCQNRLWAINDSGNGPYLFLYNTKTGGTPCIYLLENLQNIDWEDLSAFRIQGKSPGLLIGDIGDNFQSRNRLTLYRFDEPDCACKKDEAVRISPDYEKIEIVYPDSPHDTEAMFVDDETGDIFIISKSRSRSGVYRLPYPQDTESPDTLTYIGSLPFPLVVSADYSSDLKLLMVKTYDHIFIWENTQNKPVSELIFDMPERAPYDPVEPQGESVAIGPDGYYTLSEKVLLWDPVLYFYRKKE